MSKKKKEHHEEHVDETWLIPYADMLTLLLALFIVMFAMSKVDNKKLQKMSQEFSAIFSSGKGVLVESGTGNGVVSSMKESTPSNAQSESNNSKIEQDMMNEIKKNIDQKVAENGYTDKIKSKITEEGLAISIQDIILFRSGDSTVLANIQPMLIEISKMIHSLDNNIKVTGHTDNIPIATETFHSNWELSASRALNVMKFMVTSGGVDEKRFSIQAYGEYSPEETNSTEQGRARNRRVEIFILRKYSLTSNGNK
ncbi:chemotaxis protein MotB [Clostridium acetobutylicum]|uniref:Flagellar motor protein MotB n=1 Tax=Clostridium acetobutylicum (strain ATCC 824 / DSM 792 / JCM 1419 / IAM 19013 / LMG 5710 / NBRC 13948 / NRRL B-527 / VKM B-1787 / 2291 / W) TaxID=272562 RepID=Q97I11_CLOAB|nr:MULTISPECIES: flagellar motor protein MotB [Clostridium]AAK79809.1 Flagellar motor protein MotB [Clostridium acetobutylicum ATCC 824]ADZ20895.1 Flagellar motor protein MotB [Clostridium acetobutylicum EA 2018]AEI33080.1 flagellar motor protein MotB [Clostridium acetobutylicum DSM 1731]AWV79758.1 chemotaxis protein MotB [Clostridium acetobutylicum]MBC2394262.1 flagellar motor protein MotB [Clostridium acetobutylicum]